VEGRRPISITTMNGTPEPRYRIAFAGAVPGFVSLVDVE
jgi:hypothetical protein